MWYFIIFLVVISVINSIVSSPKYKGYLGEQNVFNKLKKLDQSEYKVINDLTINNSKGTSQIDHVIISVYGIFVIETKNYKGWITGNEYDDYWKQVLYKRKEKLRNPIKQNYGHVKALENYIKNYDNILIIPIVAFTKNATLKVNVKSTVVYTSQILKIINNYKDKVISKDQVDEIYTLLVNQNIESKEIKKQHVSDIRKNIREREINIQNNICPRCHGELIIRNGKRGKFYGCSSFPKCRFTQDI